MSMLRCKMRVQAVTRLINADGSTQSERVELRAVYGDTDENKGWSMWTPLGSLDITITNPDAYGKLPTGYEFYVDVTPVAAE
jgi:hypothetical protein